MGLRDAYEMVIAHELRELGYPEDKIPGLVAQLSNNDQFHSDVTESIRTHMEDFGENYGV